MFDQANPTARYSKGLLGVQRAKLARMAQPALSISQGYQDDGSTRIDSAASPSSPA